MLLLFQSMVPLCASELRLILLAQEKVINDPLGAFINLRANGNKLRSVARMDLQRTLCLAAGTSFNEFLPQAGFALLAPINQSDLSQVFIPEHGDNVTGIPRHDSTSRQEKELRVAGMRSCTGEVNNRKCRAKPSQVVGDHLLDLLGELRGDTAAGHAVKREGRRLLYAPGRGEKAVHWASVHWSSCRGGALRRRIHSGSSVRLELPPGDLDLLEMFFRIRAQAGVVLIER